MIRKIAVMLSSLLLWAAISQAQDTTVVKGWQKSLILDVTTSQSAYSDSWTGGESGSLNWIANLNGTAERQFVPWFNYRMTLRASFGQTHTQDQQTRQWAKPQKSTDLIDWEHLGRFTTRKFVDPYVAFRVETQFYQQFDNGVNAALRPMKLTESAGLARQFYAKDKDIVLSRVGLALRETVKPYLLDANATKAHDSTLTDGGLESVTDITRTLHKRIIYVGKLSLYKAFFFSGSDKVKGTPFESDWKAIDVNWENQFNVQVTRIITVNLYTQFLFDKETSHQGRLKETLALGFTFKIA